LIKRAGWIIAPLVLVVAAVIALWPREQAPPPRPPARPAPDLVAARAKAALLPCAAKTPAAALHVRAMCLGDGSMVDSAAAIGAPALINVWATWCQPCREELPLLQQYAAQPGALPVVTVVVHDSDPADSLDLLADLGVRLPTLYDGDDAIRRALRIPDALPASYLVGADGSVKMVTEPRLFRSIEQIKAVAHS